MLIDYNDLLLYLILVSSFYVRTKTLTLKRYNVFLYTHYINVAKSHYALLLNPERSQFLMMDTEIDVHVLLTVLLYVHSW